MQLTYNSKICFHFYVDAHNNVPTYFNQILKLLLLFVIEYNWVNSFLLISFFQMYIADFK